MCHGLKGLHWLKWRGGKRNISDWPPAGDRSGPVEKAERFGITALVESVGSSEIVHCKSTSRGGGVGCRGAPLQYLDVLQPPDGAGRGRMLSNRQWTFRQLGTDCLDGGRTNGNLHTGGRTNVQRPTNERPCLVLRLPEVDERTNRRTHEHLAICQDY